MSADVAITKIEAARRQLDCAVRIFFAGEDYLAIHTLAHAAYSVLSDLHRERENDAINLALKSIDRQRMNSIANFLKHADRDAKAAMLDHNPDAPAMLMTAASLLYGLLLKRTTPEMAAIDLWTSAMYPAMFEGEHPIIAAVDDDELRLILNRLKDYSREERLLVGESLIDVFRNADAQPPSCTE